MNKKTDNSNQELTDFSSTSQKWALITGSSSGIGLATARKLADLGYSLILLARRRDRLAQITQEIERNKNFKGQILPISLDLRNRREIGTFLTEYSAVLARVEILINNAGLARGVEKLQDGVVKDWEDMIDTNITGLLLLTRGILPSMVRNKTGHIVNLGSVAGRWVYPGGGVYCATKFAVRAISEGLRMDLLGTQVRVTNIEPGMVDTEFSVVRLGDVEKAKKVYEGMRPLVAEDIAETIIWCIQRPGHINIQELVIYPTDQAAVGQVHRTTFSNI